MNNATMAFSPSRQQHLDMQHAAFTPDDHDHPSIADSLSDFDAPDHDSPALRIPSQHSGFRSEESEPESDSVGPWSPPAWRRPGSGWFHHDPRLGALPSPQRSREGSPVHRAGDNDVTLLAREVPLPGSVSPEKHRSPSPSPVPERAREEARNVEGGSARASLEPEGQNGAGAAVGENASNYLLWSMHFRFRHRTEPFEAAWVYMWDLFERITKSPTSIIFSLGMAFCAFLVLRLLTQPLKTGPAPDLVKVAGLAKSFETLIHYSENGVQQVGDLQETGVAVWDLGESIRTTNMTSAPIITRTLDELSESLKTLALELTRFFANVDGDVDSILIVMEWAKRELTQVSSSPLGPLTAAFDNMHGVLCRLGLLENSNGMPTTIGNIVRELFGQTHVQRTRAALQRTFNDFLGVLEESINSELTYSTALFYLFESIDRQFLNLQRSVIRETDQQEREEDQVLASLWTRVLGSNASALRKYHKNKQLLASVRAKTVQNKHILVEHNGKLLKLKSNLEILRKKLVSPLVRSNDSSTLSVEEQIQGLDSTYEHLRAVRENQKGKLMERLYGASSRRTTLDAAIDGQAAD